MIKVFNNYCELYDLLYNDKDYAKEVDYVVKKFAQNNIVSKKILEYGSGTGLHGCLLAEKGYEITGIEISPQMYQKAKTYIQKRKLEQKFSVLCDDISKFKTKEKFGAIISLFHVMSYLTDNTVLKNTIENASYHIEKGGLFIFDVWYAPCVLTLKPQNKLKVVENKKYKIYRITEPKSRHSENIVDVKFNLIVYDKTAKTTSFVEEVHSMRYFSIPEIALLAEQNSFDIIKVEEFLTENEPSEKTWGVCFILRKR